MGLYDADDTASNGTAVAYDGQSGLSVTTTPHGLAQEQTLAAVLAQLRLNASEVTLSGVLAALAGQLHVTVDNPVTHVTVDNPTPAPETGLAKNATLESLRADVADGLNVTVQNPTANPETGLAKDSTLAQLLAAAATNQAVQNLQAAIEAFGTFVQQQQREVMNLRRQPQYARAADDTMRVTVSGGTTGIGNIQWGSFNAYPAWYSTGAPNSMDAREQMKEASRQTIQMCRVNRWKIT